MARAWAVLFLLLATPLASAAALDLHTREPVRVDGVLAFTGAGASVATTSVEAREPGALFGATGRVTVWTWTSAHVGGTVPGGPSVAAAPRVGDATAEVFTVENATLALDPRGGALGVLARVGDEGVARVLGRVDGPVQPARIVRTLATDAGLPLAPPGRAADDVAWVDEPGWPYVGNVLSPSDVMPDLDGGRIDLQGPLRLKVEGGVASFTDAHGRRVERDLRDAPGPGGAVQERRLVFEGTLASASLPLGDKVGLAAPAMTWSVDGAAAWTRATGEARADGEARSFEDADVRAVGRLDLVPDLLPTGAPGVRYAGSGDAALVLDGEAFPPERPIVRALATSRPAEAIALVALGALLARGALALFYTRLAPEDVLAHPRRLALWEAVRAQPGQRKRDLQRGLGLAWGAFTFHLRVLVSTGHVRVQREGAYAIVVPSDALGAPHVPHPSTRAVYDALPLDGAWLDVGDLRARVGFSRQRVDHHLRALEARGLARIARDERGHRSVARALPAKG